MNEKGLPTGYADETLNIINQNKQQKEQDFINASKEAMKEYADERYLTACSKREVKNKVISNEELEEKIKKTAVIVGGCLAAGFIGVVGLDLLTHFEEYMTTSDQFDGRVTFMETVERFPDNVEQVIEAASSFIKGGAR